jgi:hypothetical protein
MTTKPDLIKWVTDDGAAKISDPGSTKKLAGFIYKEKVASQFLNWMWNRVSKWFLGLQGSYYDIVIGSAAQVTAFEATHVMADLIDALAVAGSRILILDGTHTLLGNLSLTNDDLKIKSESPLAILDVSTFTATFSGARDFILLRVINSGAGDIIVSGAGAVFAGIDIPIANVTVSNGAIAETSGDTGGIKQTEFIGRLTGAHTLTTPELLASLSADTSGWVTHDSTTLSTAKATTAILSIVLYATVNGNASEAQAWLRETGSALAQDDATLKAQAYTIIEHTGIVNSYQRSTVQVQVSLDSNQDFDYLFEGVGTTKTCKIYLVGYIT